MARRQQHSKFSERLLLSVTSYQGESSEEARMRAFVEHLQLKQSLGICREWIMGALYKQFCQEQGAPANQMTASVTHFVPAEAPVPSGNTQDSVPVGVEQVENSSSNIERPPDEPMPASNSLLKGMKVM